MEKGASSKSRDKAERGKGGSRFGPVADPKIEPFVPRNDHNPWELRSWAKKTGFVSNFSGETSSSLTEKLERADLERSGGGGAPADRRGGGSSPKFEIDLVPGRTRPNRGAEIEQVSGSRNGLPRKESDGSLGFRAEDPKRLEEEPCLGDKEEDRRVGLKGNGFGGNRNENVNESDNGNRNGHGVQSSAVSAEPRKDDHKNEGDLEVGMYVDGVEPAEGEWYKPSEVKLGIRDNPGFVSLIYYALQHYLSLAGSLIFIPLIIVPAMGGSDKDTATVISTMMLVSGVTTILHCYFGTRLPLVQGSSFVYLAPALVIMNAQEFRNLTEHKFRHIMRELQGAIIVGSIFQTILGSTGLMSLFLRLINPVVVAPTVAAVGLAFFGYGFPQAGSCVEISLPQILLVLIFTLYLRGVSIFGNRVFRIYAVPLSVMIIWTYAFFLTAGGVYDFKGCSADIPSSNILVDACIKHAYTMKHCRTDVSNAWKTAAWVRIPYPLQWGIPIFHLRTSIIMIFVSLVASVDSVGTYHTASLRVNARPPTPGIVSRGIALEGLCSILAGIWGTGTGSTSLAENVHTIDVTKVASRRAVELGAVFFIVFSLFGKVGAILASIPLALAASVLCFMWALTAALGLATLQYSQTASFRNITIVGVSLFLGLSIPAYFQQYQPESSLILPSYFVSYAAASSGPVQTGSKQLDFAINGLVSMNMVVTLLVAFILDNTVPGSRQERGVYRWSHSEDMAADPSMQADYSLPRKVDKFFCWARCLC